MMNAESLSKLHYLIVNNPTKYLLGVIKGTRPFIKDLSDLNLSNFISVLFMSDTVQNVDRTGASSKFDIILRFTGVKSWNADILANLDLLDFPDLRLVIGQVCQLIDCSRVRLVGMEEQMLRIIAEERIVYGIPGPTPDDIDQYCNKMKMKRVAITNNIKVAKYKIICPSEIQSCRSGFSSLEEMLPYPIFIKPLNGCGGAGAAKIENRRTLIDWAKKNNNNNSKFLAEEYVEGDEIHILGFYQNGKTQFFPSTLRRWPMTIYKFLSTGKPMPVYDGGSKEEKLKMFRFGQKVANAFSFINGTLLFIQFFDTPNGYVLNEIACRTPGITGSSVFYQNSGINPEILQILGQVQSINIEDFIKSMPHFGLISYPTRECKNCRLTPVLKNGFRSKLEEKWIAKPGQDLHQAKRVGDLVLRLFVWNTDYNQLLLDMDYLRENYDPLANMRKL